MATTANHLPPRAAALSSPPCRRARAARATLGSFGADAEDSAQATRAPSHERIREAGLALLWLVAFVAASCTDLIERLVLLVLP